MMYQGTVEANGKWASAVFNPGWGEPGEWYMKFSDDTAYTIDNVESMGDQERFLRFLSADKYRDEIIQNNWKLTGNSDDVVARVLKFVGYDDDTRTEDEKKVAMAKAAVMEFAKHVAEDLGTNQMRSTALQFESMYENAQFIAETAMERIRVYDALKKGEKVGMGWSNESFLRNFPDSPFVARIKQLMKEDEVSAS